MAELRKHHCTDVVCVMNTGLGLCSSPITVHPGSQVLVCKGRGPGDTGHRREGARGAYGPNIRTKPVGLGPVGTWL